MKLGRIVRDSLEGAVPRLVAVQPERECVIDLATAEYQRLRHTFRGDMVPPQAIPQHYEMPLSQI